MKIAGLFAAILAVSLSLAACSSSRSDSGSSSVSDSSSSITEITGSQTTTVGSDAGQTETASVSEQTETETTTTVSEPKPDETTLKPDESVSSKATTEEQTPPAPTDNKDLKAYASETFKVRDISKEISASIEPKDALADIVEKPGNYAIVSDLNTKDIFDPFDDMLTRVDNIAHAKPDCQIFMLTQSAQVQKNDRTEVMTDGMIMAVGFNCASEDEAKKLFKLVCNEDMKQGFRDDNNEKPISESGDDYTMLMTKNKDMCMCYYRINNNVYAIAFYDIGLDGFEPVDPNYRRVYDYYAELDRLCKTIGADKLPSSLRQ